jgi:hypothetical protein
MTPTATAPQITAVQGSNPSGQPDSVHADPRKDGGQSIHIVGSNFANGIGFLISGPKADAQGQAVPGQTDGRYYTWPAVGDIDAEGCDVVVTIPIAGPYQIAAVLGNVLSDWFSFTVS